jgi:hypothetical protein
MWRTGFGRGFGPVVRQTTKWNEWITAPSIWLLVNPTSEVQRNNLRQRWCLSMRNRLQLRIQYIAIILITSVITCTVQSRVKYRYFHPGVGFLNTYDETRLLWESAAANSFTTSPPHLHTKQVKSITMSAIAKW